MGTRSLTIIKDDGNNEIAVLYRQFDGYPEGHGRDLANFLSSKTLVNGISGDGTKVFNGMPCLAVQLIASVKGPEIKAGSFYLHPAGTRVCMKCESYEKTLFDGPASEFTPALCVEA